MISYVIDYDTVMIAFLIVSVVWMVCILIKRKNGKNKIKTILLPWFFTGYVVFVLAVTLFPVEVPPGKG